MTCNYCGKPLDRFTMCNCRSQEEQELSKITIGLMQLMNEEPLTTNSLGSSQSDIGEGWELLDINALCWFLPREDEEIGSILRNFEHVLSNQNCLEEINFIIRDFQRLSAKNHIEVTRKTLVYGAKKYARDNWRGISTKDHIDHAFRHFLNWCIGNEDEEAEHCHCRLHMALAKALRPDYYGQFTPTTNGNPQARPQQVLNSSQ